MTEQTNHDRIFLQDCWEISVKATAFRIFEDDVEYIRADIVADQLAEREKQIVLMRERMEWILGYQSRPNNKVIKEQARAGLIGAQAFEMVCYELKKALAATQDLSGCILCDAEPFLHVRRLPSPGYCIVSSSDQEAIQLYKARMK
jgi:hypothetical protein